MEKEDIVIKNKLLSNLILLLGGFLFILFGILLLLNPFAMDKGGVPNWSLGIIFLPFGLVSIFKLLDSLYLVIGVNRIEVKSIFRKRIILKEEIVSYGIEEYQGKHVSGERIRLFLREGSYKFHTTQLQSIEELKTFVQGIKVETNAFAREDIGNIIAVLLFIGFTIGPALYHKFAATNSEQLMQREQIEQTGELEAIGIPAKFKSDIRIIEEEGENLKFEIKRYQNYIFEVKKGKIPKNFKTIDKQLVIFIDNKEYAQELSNKETKILRFEKPRIIPVDEIQVLE